MPYGVIQYNEDGLPICEICQKAFKRVISHVRQKHNMNEREYKKQFGFDLKKGICSKESSEISRQKVFENADKCINQNLISGGNAFRFKNGHKGRTKNQVSEQTRIRLKERLKSEPMNSLLKKSGRRVGLSGLGNKRRWQNNLTVFVDRMNKIGIQLELSINFPWVYLDKINGLKVKELFESEYGFVIAFMPIKTKQEVAFTDIKKIFKVIRNYSKNP